MVGIDEFDLMILYGPTLKVQGFPSALDPGLAWVRVREYGGVPDDTRRGHESTRVQWYVGTWVHGYMGTRGLDTSLGGAEVCNLSLSLYHTEYISYH